MLLLLSLALGATSDVNLLRLEAGTVPIERPSTFGGAWSLDAMFDGSTATGWCSAADAKGPFQMTFELEQRSAITGVDFDNSGVEEQTNPGIAAKTIEVWLSSTGPNEGFTLAVKLAAPKVGGGGALMPKDTTARWVRVVVRGNWGHRRYTELMELNVRGHPLEPRVARPPVGVWNLETGTELRLETSGSGCEVQAEPPRAWLLSGEAAGRAATYSWIEVGTTTTGTATVAIADDGTLHGVWTTNGAGAGTWLGRRRTQPLPSCADASEDLSLLARLRAARHGVTMLGGGFAGDELKLGAHAELASLRRLLAAGPSLHARVVVLGRTSEAAPDELVRAERRAQRVLEYLLAGGVPAAQLEVGYGVLRVGSAVQVEPRIEVELER